MKRTKLSIKTSPSKDYKFKVYRSNSQDEIPADLNSLALKTPIIIADESIIQHEAEMINEVIDVDVTKVPLADEMPFALNYEPLSNPIHYLLLEIDYTNPDSGGVPVTKTRVIKAEFDDTGTIVKVTHTPEATANSEDITGLGGIHIKDTTVYLKNDYIVNRLVVRAKYYMRVINVFDDDVNVKDGVIFNGPLADGLSTPNLSVQLDSVPLTSGTELPYVQLQASEGTEGKVYYYRIVAEDSIGNLSDPSGLISTHLAQSINEISYKIEVSDDNSIWTTVATLDNLEVFKFGKKGTPVYDTYGSILADKVKPILESDIVIDDGKVVSDNELGITIPNPFNFEDSAFRKRNTKSFRVKVIDTFSNESEISEGVFQNQIELPIEKVIVRRKIVTGASVEDKNIPIKLEDSDAETVKTWIRRYGIYYDSLQHQSLPADIRVSSSPIVIFGDDTVFATLTAIDQGVITGESYNYTMYTIDAFEQVSSATVIVVSV